MASSKKPRSADLAASAKSFLEPFDLRRKRLTAALSGGADSVVLLHLLHGLRPSLGFRLDAIHVHHGLSRNADAWAAACRRLCRRLGVPLRVARVRVARSGKGLEAAARAARYRVFAGLRTDYIVLAHHLDDQAETVLMNLLRGAGVRGASGMPAQAALGGRTLLRPLLDVPKEAILAHARALRLEWVEDESNADEALTRNFVRRRLGPLLQARFPRWRESLARAARHFAARELDANRLLREFLAGRGLRAPSEAKLAEMLKQLTGQGSRTLIEHDGRELRVYRGKVLVAPKRPAAAFKETAWTGETRMALSALGGELKFRKARGRGIDLKSLSGKRMVIRLRGGGERLQPDAGRPRRTLKNLFQEAGVPAWERDRLPMLFCGDELVWVPGLGVDARFQAAGATLGLLPEWRRP